MSGFEPVDWNQTGTVFNIQRYSLHDGPGIRTILFFKGCGLRCRWCCNPESQESVPQVLFTGSLCIGCRSCEKVCPVHAITFEGNGRILRDRCINCGACARACVSGALALKGRKITVREALGELGKDEIYYSYSGGGVTLSGGEALLQPDFAREVLKACRGRGWNTAIETALFVDRGAVEAVLPYTDVFLCDFKLFDRTMHRQYTGQYNDKILENLSWLSENGAKVILRIPLIPSVNDSEDNLLRTAEFAKKFTGIEEIDLLPYHRLGVGKYEQLDRAYPLPDVRQPKKDKVEALAALIRNAGFTVKVGG